MDLPKTRWFSNIGLTLCFAGALVFTGCKNKTTKAGISSNQSRKLNVVFILSDDLGLHDLSCTGSRFYETPNIDRIATEGTIFSQGYSASRVCSPSRASIMTGKFTASHGVTDWIGAASGAAWREEKRNDKLLPADYEHALPRQGVTLAEVMKSNGYKTFFAGKWHLGEKGSYPEDYGFEINKGGWESGSPSGGYFSPWINPSLENIVMGENLSIRLANETTSFIEQNKDQPFFAFLSFYAVHGPIQTTEEKWKKYREKAEQQGIQKLGYEMERVLPIRMVQDNPIYAGLVETMDDAVGLVLKKLHELNLEENTIIIFTSDNGGVASGDSFSTSNLPLRGGKGYQWEGGIRVPYFIKIPGIANGSTVDTPVIGAVFFSTILDLTNLTLSTSQQADGVSLKPLLQGKTISDRSLFWHYPHYGNQGGEPSSIIRKQNWKLIHYWEDDRNELYDLSSDPGEQKNVAKKYRKITSELIHELQTFLKSSNAKTPAHDTTFDEVLAKQMHQDKINKLLPKLEEQRKLFLSKSFQPNEDWWGSKVTKD